MTRPPIRLLESADASPAERALLEAGRTVPPVHYDVAAGAAQFQASLQGLSATSTVAAVKTATLTKLAAVLVPTLGVLATYYALRSAPQPVERSAAPAVVESPVVEVEPPVTIELPARDEVFAPAPVETRSHPPRRSRSESARSASSRVTVVEPAHEVATHEVAAHDVTPHEVTPHEITAAQIEEPAPTPHEEPKPEPTPTPDSINELRGIASARGLIERDPAAALSILQRLSRVHPNGYFVEEREALTVLALAAQDDEDAARKQAARFLKRYPTSPFADRIRAATR